MTEGLTVLSGTLIGHIDGADAMKSAGWKRLVAEYAKLAMLLGSASSRRQILLGK